MDTTPPRTLRFGPGQRFTLDLTARTLHDAGTPLPIGARAFDVLAALAGAGGELVTKDRLMQQGWPGLVVEEANLHVQVSQLRKQLGTQAIATVPTLGYRFAWSVAAGDAGAPAHNLPAARTAFIGRDALLVRAAECLASTRLLTLIGIGGAGKTRLALALAQRHCAAYAQGVCWLDLAPLEHAEQVPAALAQALGVRLQGSQDATDQIVAALAGQRRLIVLDNCEHLVQAVAEFADALLAALPALTLVATSREALALHGELVLPVPPLALPATGASADQVAANEAVRLFAERAAMAAPTLALAAPDAALLAQICRRVDGIPLAIELAAAQLRVVSPAQLLELLDERFRLLADPRRALPRQQTMQAVIAWSFEHLRDDERPLLLALAMCSGGCDLDAVAALMGHEKASSRTALLAGLSRLAEQSLLVVDHVALEAGAAPARYRLLETVRQFALEQAQGLPEAALLRRRHVEHFLAIAEAHDAEIEARGEGAAAMARLDLERENLLRAIEHCTREAADPQLLTQGLRLVGALRHYWIARGMAQVGLRVTMAMLVPVGTDARAGAGAPPRAPDRAWLLALVAAAQVQAGCSRHEESLASGRMLAAHAGRLGEHPIEARAQRHIAVQLDLLGRHDEAAQHHEAARRHAEQLGDDGLLADALSSLALRASLQKRFADGAALMEQVIPIRRRIGHGWRLAAALLNAGYTAGELGDHAAARRWLIEAGEVLPRIGSLELDQALVDMSAGLAQRESAWATLVELRAADAAHRAAHGRRTAARAEQAQIDAEERSGLVAAREALGAGAYERAWARGSQQPIDRAREAAVRWLSSTP